MERVEVSVFVFIAIIGFMALLLGIVEEVRKK